MIKKSILLLGALTALGCGGSTETGAGGAGGASTSTSAGGAGGTGGAQASCADVLCSGPGEICVDGSCVVDCRKPSAQPCGAGTVCDVSDKSPGQCVDAGAPCVTSSAPEPCGDKVCGPGSACDGNGKCYPRVPCGNVECDATGCWGTFCACTRAVSCAPASLGMPAEPGTLHDDTFRGGLVDLEFAPDCSAWGVTLVSGPDYLRSIAPDGSVSSYAGVTNLNMGEVSVLRNFAVPKAGPDSPPLGSPPIPPNPPSDLEVSLTYICCATCGCQLNTVPQGAVRFDPATGQLPLVIPSQTYTNGTGPFGGAVIDTGPAGLSYGTDRVLYVGNVDANGDYYRLDLASSQKTLLTTFASRVYASTPFDAITMLVALEGGEIRKLRLTDGTSSVWSVSDQPVTGMVRDFFDGAVYVARKDGSILRYDEDGQGAAFQSIAGASRVSIAPDGYLYALTVPPPYYDHMPTIERWQLPMTR